MTFFGRLGNTSVGSLVKTIMKMVASDVCWERFSWTGRMDRKNALEEMNFTKCLTGKWHLIFLQYITSRVRFESESTSTQQN